MIAEPISPPIENPRRWRWTYSDLLRLDEMGFFADHRIELIDGEIVECAPMSPPRACVLSTLCADLHRIFDGGLIVRLRSPFTMEHNNLLQPDVLVVRGMKGEFKDRHPSTAELIIEVSDSTLAQDRTTKASLYARAGVPEYWIVNLVDEQIEVLRRPQASPSARFGFAYMETVIYRGDDKITPLSALEKQIAASDILP